MVVGEFTQEADLVVIGGGPGGYSAAFRAAELGVKTVIVDPHETLGGVCLHDGCIPSKTLLHLAEIINSAQSAKDFGVRFTKPRINPAAIRGWKTKTLGRLSLGLENLCKKHGVEHIRGRAQFEDSRHLAIREGSIPRLHFRRAIVAIGSRPVLHPQLPANHPHVLTPESALRLNEIPNSVLIIGGNYMAAEVATIYAALGSKVTMVDEGDRLLPEADPDLTRPLVKRLNARLRTIRMATSICEVSEQDGGLHVTFSGKDAPKPWRYDEIVVALGQGLMCDDLQLEKTLVQRGPDGFITVDEQLRTSDPRIMATGDATGPPLLADKAMHQGRVAAEVIAGRQSAFEPNVVPAAIFTDPQIAWCGLTEEQAKIEQIPHAVARIPWGASGRAVGMDFADGVTKIIYQPGSHLVLGVGIVGANACELISEGALAVEMGATLTDLAATLHPHPTLSELLSDAARQADVH